MNKSMGLGTLALIACAILWSTGGLFIKLVDAHPMAIAGARSLVALIFILLVQRPSLKFDMAQGIAGLAYALTMIFFVIANKTTSAANAILLQYAAPVWVVVLGFFLYKEKPRPQEVISLSLVVVGIVIFFSKGLGGGSIGGDLVAVASGLTFATYFVLLAKQKGPSIIGAIVISHFIAAVAGLPWMFSMEPSTGNILGILALGVIQLGISSLLFAYAITRVKPLPAILITTLEPILNPLWVFIIQGEVPGPEALIGGGIIIAAILVLQVYNAHQKSKSPRSGDPEPQGSLNPGEPS